MQSPLIIVVGCVPAWMNVSVELLHHCGRMCSNLDGSAELFHHCGRMCSHLDGCECCAFLTSRSDISAEEDLYGG